MTQRPSPFLLAVLLAAGGGVTTWIALFSASLPTALLALACFSFAWVAARRAYPIVAFNVGALAIVTMVSLPFLRVEQRQGGGFQQTFSDSANVFIVDEALGHRPAANLHTTATLHVDGEKIYDVTYTTDEYGLRRSPPEANAALAGCILFFGCSYMFGEGVEDNETLPYFVGTKTEGHYRIRNFGFSGYGPHHMLAAIESGLVDRAADCAATVAIFQSHPHHVRRAAGKWWWDRYGPWYELGDDGRLVRRGRFIDKPYARWRNRLFASNFGQRFRDREQPDGDDVRLVLEILQASRQALEERYPGIEFHVLHWDINGSDFLSAVSPETGIVVHPLSGVLPFREPGWEEALLLPRDVHPTATTHARIAAYVVDAILDRRNDSPAQR